MHGPRTQRQFVLLSIFGSTWESLSFNLGPTLNTIKSPFSLRGFFRLSQTRRFFFSFLLYFLWVRRRPSSIVVYVMMQVEGSLLLALQAVVVCYKQLKWEKEIYSVTRVAIASASGTCWMGKSGEAKGKKETKKKRRKTNLKRRNTLV